MARLHCFALCHGSLAVVSLVLFLRFSPIRRPSSPTVVFGSFVFRSFVFRSFVFRSFAFRSFVFRSFVFRSFVFRSFVFRKRGLRR